MPDLPSPLTTTSNGSWNSDVAAIIRSPCSSTGAISNPFGSFNSVPGNIYCLPRPQEPDMYKAVQGFKIISATIILHIQLFDQLLDFKIDSLGATWAGCWVLFRHGYWIHLCTQLCTQLYRTFRTWLRRKNETVENDGTPFRVERKGDEFIIRGNCSPHDSRFKEAVLEECWTGKLLLAESNGEWMRLFR
ncbi:uncharacterized protein K444DRAFT_667154 [Hyaloscypha bicolor E]|uniref:Uncharacterized protein n=1 Tax=Hyaloscypha bicolor E TaxID=1095630 RepID=A0A2J6SX22_9HELO|nr:uncharacterized protein K444DRAFT_667154 [Hyaloscypha bicolor E]PMD55327.1 hypothetical protein K444DRAFT_667154 [Hyaloscypha bicolor E]